MYTFFFGIGPGACCSSNNERIHRVSSVAGPRRDRGVRCVDQVSTIRECQYY